MADRKVTSLTELTSPATGDLLHVVDISEATSSAKNKKIQYTTLLRSLPDGSATTPTLGWSTDSGTSGLFRVAANEIGISANQTGVAKFTDQGLLIGSATSTPAAQLHLVSTDTSDQVVIENSSGNADTAPDLVLFRNSASPANSDNLGNLVFRGEDSAGDIHNYASLTSSISVVTNGAEDGILDLMSSASGTLASRVRLKADKVGIHETDPSFPLHISNTGAGTTLNIECSTNDASSGADITLLRRRGASGAGQDNDIISTIWFRGKNDASSPEEVDYGCIEGSISDASDGTEDGKIQVKTVKAGTLTSRMVLSSDDLFLDNLNIRTHLGTGTKIGTATGQKIGFWNATPVDQPAAVSDLTVSASSGTLPTANGSITVSNAASPTNAELLEFCVELEAKLEAALARLRETGLIAT
jgi:hypothetical protein